MRGTWATTELTDPTPVLTTLDAVLETAPVTAAGTAVTVFTAAATGATGTALVAALTVLVTALTVLATGAAGVAGAAALTVLVTVLTVLATGAAGVAGAAALTVLVTGAAGVVGVAALATGATAAAGGEADDAGEGVTAFGATATGELGAATGTAAEVTADAAEGTDATGLGAAAIARLGNAAMITNSKLAAANIRKRSRRSPNSLRLFPKSSKTYPSRCDGSPIRGPARESDKYGRFLEPASPSRYPSSPPDGRRSRLRADRRALDSRRRRTEAAVGRVTPRILALAAALSQPTIGKPQRRLTTYDQ